MDIYKIESIPIWRPDKSKIVKTLTNNLNKLKNVDCENIAVSSLIIDKPDEAQKVLK